MEETRKKQKYRAIKYIWKESWIGKEAYLSEMKAAQQACVAEIVLDHQMDVGDLSESQLKLLLMHIKKYAQVTIEDIGDRCYMKIKVEVML